MRFLKTIFNKKIDNYTNIYVIENLLVKLINFFVKFCWLCMSNLNYRNIILYYKNNNFKIIVINISNCLLNFIVIDYFCD